MKINLTKTPVVILLAMVCCMLWGSAFPMIKLGYAEFDIPQDSVSSQILFAGCRFTLAGIMAWCIGSIADKKPMLPRKKALPKIALLSVFQTILQYLFFYVGLARCTGVKSSVINGTSAFVCILISALVFRMERLTLPKILGCVLGAAGIVIVNLGGTFDSSFTFMGEGFMLLSMISYAVSTVLVKKFSAEDSPVMLSSLQFILGGIVMIAVGLCFGGTLPIFTAKGILILLYLGFLSAVAYSLWSVLLKYNPVSKVAIFSFMTPICGVLLSALLLGETAQAFSLNALIALLTVCGGIFIVNYFGERGGKNDIS